MAIATCQNEDCERGQWKLLKHPSEYARGPTCPDCGTSRVGVEIQESDQPPRPGTPDVPAQQAPAPPATPEAGHEMQAHEESILSSEIALQRGMEAGELFHMFRSGNPAEQAMAKGAALKGAAGFLGSLGENVQREAEEGMQRAQQLSDDDIAVSNNYPRCPTCRKQLTSIPNGGEFACPGCGEILEAVPQAEV